jgi:threonine/homoserine/homoserine lactone efflux protein
MRGGLAATLGVMVGDQVLMWLAVGGVAALLPLPGGLPAVQWVGAAYLAWLGCACWRKPGDAPAVAAPPRQYFRQAF